MQKKVFVYGTGASTQKNLLALSLKYEILGFIQTDCENSNRSLFSKPIISPEDLTGREFDFIIICSPDNGEIQRELLNYSVTNLVHVDDCIDIKKLTSEITRSNVEKQLRIVKSMTPPALSYEHISSCTLLANRNELLKEMKPDSIAAELGVASGEYSKKIIDTVKPKKLHLIDLWSSERFGEDLMGDVERFFSDNIAKKQVQIHRNSSIDAADTFRDDYFDWVYIDTDHSYQTTLAELRLYKKKVKQDGYLMGHDYVMGNWKKHLKYGVIEAVHQFCVEEGYELAYLTMELNQSFALRKIGKQYTFKE